MVWTEAPCKAEQTAVADLPAKALYEMLLLLGHELLMLLAQLMVMPQQMQQAMQQQDTALVL